ncbi:MAG: hypothetical protein QXE01_02025 [Sulfolobales archaeon]
MKKALNTLIILGFITVVMSIYIHDPIFLGQYTDYIAIYIRDPSKTITGYPYLDYPFEYTPLIALQWMVASKIALYMLSHGFDPLSSITRAFYITNTIFYALYILAIYFIAQEANASRVSKALAIISPSMVYYLFYNWDISASALMAIGLFLLLRARYYMASFFLGLAASIKIFPGIAILTSAIIMYREGLGLRKILIALAIGVSTALAPYIILLLVYAPAFFYIISYHSNWYCENCFYVLFTSDIFDPRFRMVSTALMISIPLLYSFYIFKYSSITKHLSVMAPLISTSLSISFSYVYSPQMNIMISPLYIALRDKKTYLLLLQDILNTLIMILWFHESTISGSLGIESRGPWHRESPIQWIAFTRILLLWIIAILIARELKLETRFKSI